MENLDFTFKTNKLTQSHHLNSDNPPTEAKIELREEAHAAAWDRLFEELEKRKR